MRITEDVACSLYKQGLSEVLNHRVPTWVPLQWKGSTEQRALCMKTNWIAIQLPAWAVSKLRFHWASLSITAQAEVIIGIFASLLVKLFTQPRAWVNLLNTKVYWRWQVSSQVLHKNSTFLALHCIFICFRVFIYFLLKATSNKRLHINLSNFWF